LAKLKRVGVFSLGKVMGIGGFLVGLLAALVYGGLFLLMAGSQKNPAALYGLGGVFVVLLPVIYGFVSFIGGIVHALVINVVLGVSGGLELELGESQ
jgi:hypothetical protein